MRIFVLYPISVSRRVSRNSGFARQARFSVMILFLERYGACASIAMRVTGAQSRDCAGLMVGLAIFPPAVSVFKIRDH